MPGRGGAEEPWAPTLAGGASGIRPERRFADGHLADIRPYGRLPGGHRPGVRPDKHFAGGEPTFGRETPARAACTWRDGDGAALRTLDFPQRSVEAPPDGPLNAAAVRRNSDAFTLHEASLRGTDVERPAYEATIERNGGFSSRHAATATAWRPKSAGRRIPGSTALGGEDPRPLRRPRLSNPYGVVWQSPGQRPGLKVFHLPNPVGVEQVAVRAPDRTRTGLALMVSPASRDGSRTG